MKENPILQCECGAVLTGNALPACETWVCPKCQKSAELTLPGKSAMNNELVAIDIDGARYLAWKSALEEQIEQNKIIAKRKAAYCGADCWWCRGCKLAASQEWLEEHRLETGHTKCPMCRSENWMRFEILEGGAASSDSDSAI